MGSFWRSGLLKGMRSIQLFLAAAAVLLFFQAAAWAQSQSASAQFQSSAPPAQGGPLAGIHYGEHHWEIYGGLAYSHFNAGPHLIQGANLGGFDAQVARFFTPRWAAAANVRGYYGTSGVVANTYGIEGPFVSEHMFMAGPEYRGPSNEHVSMTFHALVGGAYGNFEHGIGNVPPGNLGLFSNQFTFGSALGGSIDLNRSPRLAFRISPDATLTNFGSAGIKEQFAISVGLVYRMGKSIYKK